MKAAMEELERRQAKAKADGQDGIRVSESEAEARKMKQTNGGFDPSYNAERSWERYQNRRANGVSISPG